MIDKISRKILLLLSSDNQSEQEKEIMLFGITRIVEDIPKAIGIILIGLILKIIKEITVVTIIMMIYKTFAGGAHAKTNLGCFIYSVVFYLSIIYSSKYLLFYGINKVGIYILMYIFSIYAILVYVPADVPEIPKVNKNIRRSLKIKSLVILNIVYIITFIFVKDIITQNLIIYSTFFISLMTTRTIYNIFKSEYGYETYIPDELL